MLNVDGWTDGRTYERMNVRTDERTNGRKLARLCLPAKAGATKREFMTHRINVMHALVKFHEYIPYSLGVMARTRLTIWNLVKGK